MPMPPNYDYDSENAMNNQKQKMLEIMLQQSQEAIPTPGAGTNGVAPISPWQILGKVLQSTQAHHGLNQLAAKREELSSRYKTDLTEGMERLISTRDGSSSMEESRALQPNADGSLQKVPVNIPGDPKKAMLEAIASNHPVLRELGMKMATGKPEAQNGLNAKDALAHFDPMSVAANPNDPTKWAPKKDIRPLTEGGLFDVTDGKSARLLPGGPTASMPFGLDGVGAVQGRSSDGKITPIGGTAPRVDVSVNSGPKAGAAEFFKNTAKKVDELGALAQSASNNLNTIAELRNLDKKGIYSNVTTGPATFFQNLGQIIGIPVDAAKLGNTETFSALTTDLWQGLVSKYGGNRGVTKEEAAEIKTMLPLAGKSPEARGQLFTILENVAKRQIGQYEQSNKAFAEASAAEDPNIFIKNAPNIYLPSEQTTQPALPRSPVKTGTAENPMSYEEYVRKQQGGK